MLHIKDLTYHPTAATQAILKSVSLHLAPQKLGLVVGASGSGKSTLLEIMAGLVEPSKGKISWGEQELTSEDLQQLAGLVFQFPERHFCGGTVLEELRLGHPELGSDRVHKALEEVGLDHLSLNASPYDLSGGQQRRLALAVQLIREPNVLLLDEPTAGLDWSMKQQLVNLLAKLKAHWTLFIVTHDAGDLLEIADTCWTINQGELVEINPLNLTRNYQQSSLA
jgi:energy-coupling factor transport system ATP-binding protein